MYIDAWIENKNKPVLYVDQDETLLLLKNAESVAKMGYWANQNAVFSTIMGHPVGVIKRPRADEFLVECGKIAPTFVLTVGLTGFQTRVLESVGLLDKVRGVFGRDQYDRVPKTGGVLVDNMHPHTNIVVEKLDAMGGGVYVNIADWSGTDKTDDALMETLLHIKRVLSLS